MEQDSLNDTGDSASSSSSTVKPGESRKAAFGRWTTALLSTVSLYDKLWATRQRPTAETAVKFRDSTNRYDGILDYDGELWPSEAQSPPEAKKPVFFDWMSLLSPGKVPSYAHPRNPSIAQITPTYTRPGKETPTVGVVSSIDTPVFEVPRDPSGLPLSPAVTVGKTSTGVCGRGVLGRWGPNLAGDALITRRHPSTGKLQVVLIKRTDGSKKYALPGGFVDNVEARAPERTAIREFLEEALNVHSNERFREGEKSYDALQRVFGEFSIHSAAGKGEVVFKQAAKLKVGGLVYAGFMSDERNTDNAWIETVALTWHLKEPEASEVELASGDDAAKDSAAFYDVVDDPVLKAKGVTPLQNLFAAHSLLLQLLLEKFHPAELAKAAGRVSKS